MKLHQIIDKLEEIIPIKGTEMFPKVLVSGHLDKDIKKVALCLDFSSKSLESAKKSSCDLLLVHHGPANYDSITNRVTNKKIDLAEKLKVAVYTLPFCLDICALSTTVGFAKILGLKFEPVTVCYQGRSVDNAMVKLTNRISHVSLFKRLKMYPSNYLRIFGTQKSFYSRIFIAAGGGFQVDLMEQVKPEVYISGDLNIRALRFAEETKILLVELSHSSMENFSLKFLAENLNRKIGVTVTFLEQEEPIIMNIK